jgi:hypothetical protein
MQLYEEYLKRSGIKSCEIVKHVDKATIFYKSDSDQYWRILYIRWIEPIIHPGHYSIKILKPMHDIGVVSLDKSFLENILRIDKKLHWDEYEEFILGWSKTISYKDVAYTKERAYIAAWEMFLCCFDGILAKSGCSHLFFPTIDTKISIKRRCSQIDESIKYCRKYIPNVYFAWVERMKRYLDYQCFWLAEIVKRNSL